MTIYPIGSARRRNRLRLSLATICPIGWNLNRRLLPSPFQPPRLRHLTWMMLSPGLMIRPPSKVFNRVKL
jgi:hypothetical protein